MYFWIMKDLSKEQNYKKMELYKSFCWTIQSTDSANRNHSLWQNLSDINSLNEKISSNWLSLFTTQIKPIKHNDPYFSLWQEQLALDSALLEYSSAKRELEDLKSNRETLKHWISIESASDHQAESYSESKSITYDAKEISPSFIIEGKFLRGNYSNDLELIENFCCSLNYHDLGTILQVFDRIINISNSKVKLWRTAVNFHKANIKRLTGNFLARPYVAQVKITNKTIPGSGKDEDEIEKYVFSNNISNQFHLVTNFNNDKGSKASLPKFTKQSHLRRKQQHIPA